MMGGGVLIKICSKAVRSHLHFWWSWWWWWWWQWWRTLSHIDAKKTIYGIKCLWEFGCTPSWWGWCWVQACVPREAWQGLGSTTTVSVTRGSSANKRSCFLSIISAIRTITVTGGPLKLQQILSNLKQHMKSKWKSTVPRCEKLLQMHVCLSPDQIYNGKAKITSLKWLLFQVPGNIEGIHSN